MSRRALLLSVVFCLGFGLPAQAAKLRYQVKAGDTWKTVSKMQAKGSIEVAGMNLPFELDAKSTTTQKITAVIPDSSFVSSIDHTEDSVKIKVAGMEIEQQQPSPGAITATHNPMGTLIKVDGLAGAIGPNGPDISRVLSSMVNPFPDKDVKAGDTWEVTPEKSIIPVHIKAKLLALEKEGGKDVARIEYTMKMTGDDLNKVCRDLIKAQDIEMGGPGMSSVITVTIDRATGRQLKSKGTVEIDISAKTMGMELRQTFSGTMEEEAAT